MALAMRLADVHEVIEHPVEAIDQVSPGPDVDVVVLDVGEPAAAIYALDRLRATGDTTPVLIVSGYQPAWAGLVAVDLPDVVVVPLPITRAALLDGVSDLAATRSRPEVVVLPPEPAPSRLAFPELAFPDWDARSPESAPASPSQVDLPAEQEQAVAGWMAPFAAPAGRGEPAAWAVRSAPASPVIEVDDTDHDTDHDTDDALDAGDAVVEARSGADVAPSGSSPPPLPTLDRGGWERLISPPGQVRAEPSAVPAPTVEPIAQDSAVLSDVETAAERWFPVTPPTVAEAPVAEAPVAEAPVAEAPVVDTAAADTAVFAPAAVEAPMPVEQDDAPAEHRRRGGGALWSPPWLRRPHLRTPALPGRSEQDTNRAEEPAAAAPDTVLAPAPWLGSDSPVGAEPAAEVKLEPPTAAPQPPPLPQQGPQPVPPPLPSLLPPPLPWPPPIAAASTLFEPPVIQPPPLPAPPMQEPEASPVEESSAVEAPALARRDSSAPAMSLGAVDTRSLILPFTPPREEPASAPENGWAGQNFDWWSGLAAGLSVPAAAQPAPESDQPTPVVDEPAAEDPGVDEELLDEEPVAEDAVEVEPDHDDVIRDEPDPPIADDVPDDVSDGISPAGEPDDVQTASAETPVDEVPEESVVEAPRWNESGWDPLPSPPALPEPPPLPGPPALLQLPALPALPEPPAPLQPPPLPQPITHHDDRPAEPAAATEPDSPRIGRHDSDPLVNGLTERIGDLFGVADTAQALADEIVERADADAAAVLVPDGGVWRVSGGVGLRPLERRLVLDGSHWLVSEIAIGGRALLVEDTDVVRSKLAGAPLAAWRHLLAVPIPEVRAAVVLARGFEAGPFSERDLGAVVEPVREGAVLLQSALQTRHLARLLAPLREVDPSH